VARIRGKINSYRVLEEKPDAKDLLKDAGIHGRIILKPILQTYG
jgi:hypothetical protein